jgi:hypothetical protein
VPDRQLFFSLQLQTPERFDAMLAELTSKMLRQLGYADGEIDEVTGLVNAELGRRRQDPASKSVLEFRTEGADLLMSMSDDRGRQWNASRPLP